MTGLELSDNQVVLRLVFAAAVGALVGIDREAHGKPAGVRTHALVALGAAVVTLCTVQFLDRAEADPAALTRVIQGVIAGVGFLGGGAILKARDQDAVHGLTTAATIWIVATLGIASGGGHWLIAGTTVVLTVIVLVLGRRIDALLRRKGPQ